MSSSDVIKSLAFVIIFCVAALAAPVAKEDVVVTSKASGAEIENQERELEDLISLAHNQATKSNVQVQKVHHSSMESHDGETVKTDTTEEKVVSAQDGSVIADVKQEVKEASSGQGEKPEAVVETEVDIPEAGIHKAFVETEDNTQDENSDESESDNVTDEDVDDGNDKEEDDAGEVVADDDGDDDVVDESDVPLTTEDMAQYLFITQQFEDFLPALERLVNLSKMSATDAAIYAQAVIEEYEKINIAALRNQFDAEKRSSQQAFYPPPPVMVPELSVNEQAMPNYAPYLLQGNFFPEQQQQQQQQQQFLTQEQLQQIQQSQAFSGDSNPMYPIPGPYPISSARIGMSPAQFPMNAAQFPMNAAQSMDPLDFMAVLYDAAYGKDNPEAQEIVQLLYDRVSRDDNPNDLEQIRDLLIDTVSSSMYENQLPLTNEVPEFYQGAELSPPPESEMIPSPNMGLEQGEEEGDDNDDDAKRSGTEVNESDEESEETDDDKDETKDKEQNEETKVKDSTDKDLEDELSNISSDAQESGKN